jgi:tetratricopeptide (TPR) repeat protein
VPSALSNSDHGSRLIAAALESYPGFIAHDARRRIVGFFSFRREQLADDELRDQLFDAVAASDIYTVRKVTKRHRERVIALFPTWRTLPSAVRSDPDQAKFWAEGLIGVASVVAESGDGSLMAQLQEPAGKNPVVSWQNAISAAQAAMDTADHSSAISLLEKALEDSKGLTGTAVDDLLPKTYGLLGAAYLRAGNNEKARSFTLKAKEYCVRVGDAQGTEIYTKNLETIDTVRSGMPVFRDSQDRSLNVEDLQRAAGPLQWEVYGGDAPPPEAEALHQQGRAAGARGDYPEALALLTQAAERAPRWPYPLYDRAFTHLLMQNFDAALLDYQRTANLAPRGFFMALAAVDTLRREQSGEFPRGLYLAYVALERIPDRAQQRQLLEQFVQKYPGFAPGWQKFAGLLENTSDRMNAIEKGLAARPDNDTRGLLLLNKALALHNSGEYENAVRLLNELVADPASTSSTEALARTALGWIAAG